MSRVNESEFIKYKEFVKFTVGYVHTSLNYIYTCNTGVSTRLPA